MATAILFVCYAFHKLALMFTITYHKLAKDPPSIPRRPSHLLSFSKMPLVADQAFYLNQPLDQACRESESDAYEFEEMLR